MISEGRRSATEVAGLIGELENFDPKKVERGTVYVRGLFSSKNVSMSLLYLSPRAKIKEHSNDEYSENYECGLRFLPALGNPWYGEWHG